jgi:GGDEF domain-containing protein
LAESDAAHAPAATVRYGVAAFPADGTRPNDLVAAADHRLYRMRNRAPQPLATAS